jgi:hypothetical protein
MFDRGRDEREKDLVDDSRQTGARCEPMGRLTVED